MIFLDFPVNHELRFLNLSIYYFSQIWEVLRSYFVKSLLFAHIFLHEAVKVWPLGIGQRLCSFLPPPNFLLFRWRMRTRGLLLEYCLLSQFPPLGCRLVTRTAGGENWWPHSQLNGLDILPQSLCYCLFVRVSEKLLCTFCSSFIAVFCGRKGVYLFHFSISISN